MKKASVVMEMRRLIIGCKEVLLCVCVCVCVCVCLRPSTVKASSVWGWNSRGQINDVVLKTFLSSAKSLHRYFSK